MHRRQAVHPSFDANAALRGRIRFTRLLAYSLASSLARSPVSVRGFIYMYIIERADFQGLPRASVIPSRAKHSRPHSSLLRARVKHLERIKPPLSRHDFCGSAPAKA